MSQYFAVANPSFPVPLAHSCPPKTASGVVLRSPPLFSPPTADAKAIICNGAGGNTVGAAEQRDPSKQMSHTIVSKKDKVGRSGRNYPSFPEASRATTTARRAADEAVAATSASCAAVAFAAAASAT